MKRKYAYLIFVLLILSIWMGYMSYNNLWYLFSNFYGISITMIFGSFIAGISSEGGGAIAFPVLTLLFDVHPFDARNFSLLIQSIGMTGASLFIYSKRIPVLNQIIPLACSIGFVGYLLGNFILVGHIKPSAIKILFVFIWLSLAYALTKLNVRSHRSYLDLHTFNHFDWMILVLAAFLGGVLTSLFGNGLDIIVFTCLVLYFKIDIRLATATSIILMSIISVFASIFNVYQEYVSETVYQYWLVSIPFVIFGAPFGSKIMSILSPRVVTLILISIIGVQWIGAILIVKPTYTEIVIGIIGMVGGLVLFSFMISKGKSIIPESGDTQ
ncbi:MAG: sulfite exporter TauE/SafE family protein [Lewinellaceae bacterium]|nr:sulfite exporter TauE/SafE family protein [Lewinellaceae bacterium]